jgi:hypothetical protein
MARTNMNLNNIGYRLSETIFAQIWRSVDIFVYDSVIHSVQVPVKESVEDPNYSVRGSVGDSVRSRYESR